MTNENLTVRLFNELYSRSELSMKAREKFPLPSEYFRAKTISEEKLISLEGFLSFFTDATETEIDEMMLRNEAPYFFNSQVLFEILTDTLKRFIDGHLEGTGQAQALKRAYFKLKSNLADEIPEILSENPNFISEDGFREWLEGRELREKTEVWRENGLGCIYCYEEGSVYKNGSMFSCRLCHRSWRRH